MVLSEVAKGKPGGKVVALVDVRIVELPPEEYQAGNEHMCGLLQYTLYGTRDAAQNWEDRPASTLSELTLTRGIAGPRVWQGCITGEHIVATVHGNDITICGEGSAVELSIKRISRKFEIEKQVIGEDPDLKRAKEH